MGKAGAGRVDTADHHRTASHARTSGHGSGMNFLNFLNFLRQKCARVSRSRAATSTANSCNFDTVSVNVRRRVDSNSHDAASTSYWTFTLSLFSLFATYTSCPPMASCAPSTQPHPEDVYMHEIDNNAIPSPSSGLPWVFTERAIRAQNAVRVFL